MFTSLKQTAALAVTGLALAALAAAPAQAQVTTNIYATHTSNDGGGAPYADFVGTLNTPGITFGTDTGFNWHPFGLSEFGADSTGCLDVAAAGDQTFTLTSDDGSLLFIDGSLVVDNGGPRSPSSNSGSAYLTAGMHTFEVQFYEDFGGPSGLDLALPDGVTYCPVPEASTTASLGLLLALGMGGVVLAARKKSVKA